MSGRPQGLWAQSVEREVLPQPQETGSRLAGTE